jgi:hypothetical protein
LTNPLPFGQGNRERNFQELSMSARILQRPKNAMQSGRGRTNEWVLEFQSNEPRKADPLMGWAGSGDTQSQVQLTFPTLDAARAYADKKGIAATYIPTPPKTLKLQAYADNFR